MKKIIIGMLVSVCCILMVINYQIYGAVKASDQDLIAGTLIPSGTVMAFAGSSAPSGWLLCDGSEISQTTYAKLYAALSTTYNTQYNPVTGSNWSAPSGGNFRIPDYRGIFLRGVGTPNGLDAVTLGAKQADKTKQNGLTVNGGTASLTGNVSGGTASLTGSVSGGTASLTGTTTFASTAHTHTPPSHFSSTYTNSYAGWVYTGGGNATADSPPNTSAPNGGSPTTASVGISSTGASNGTLAVSNTAASNGTLAVSHTAASISASDNETRPINKGVNYIIKY